MATCVLLGKNEKQFVVVSCNRALSESYSKSFQENKEDAAINVIKTAAAVNDMGVGSAKVSFSLYEDGFESFSVKRIEDSIVLIPYYEPEDRENYIYLNKNENGEYQIDKSSEAGKNFALGLDTRDFVDEVSEYFQTEVKALITLTNETLKRELAEKGEGHIAILSKDGFEVKNRRTEKSKLEIKNHTPKLERTYGKKQTEIER